MEDLKFDGINEAVEYENGLKDALRFLEENNTDDAYNIAIDVLEKKLARVKAWIDSTIEEYADGF